MSQELIYTSAPKGLKLGSRGFCTVASTSGMAKNLADRLEALSGYKHLFAPGDRQARLNPVNFSYLRFKLGGRTYWLLSRIADAGLDYTQRTNKLAHHIALDQAELVLAGPAWLASQPDFFATAWTGEPRILAAQRQIPPGQLQARVCRTWADVAGDAGWAGVLAESLLIHALPEAYIICKPDTDRLALILEAQSLFPPERRWDATFSTYFTKVPPGVDCRWRCIIDGTPEAARARQSPEKLVIDLVRPLDVATGGELVLVARTGKPTGKSDVTAAAKETVAAAGRLSGQPTVPALPGSSATSPRAQILGATPEVPPALPSMSDAVSRVSRPRRRRPIWKATVYACSLVIAMILGGFGFWGFQTIRRPVAVSEPQPVSRSGADHGARERRSPPEDKKRIRDKEPPPDQDQGNPGPSGGDPCSTQGSGTPLPSESTDSDHNENPGADPTVEPSGGAGPSEPPEHLFVDFDPPLYAKLKAVLRGSTYTDKWMDRVRLGGFPMPNPPVAIALLGVAIDEDDKPLVDVHNINESTWEILRHSRVVAEIGIARTDENLGELYFQWKKNINETQDKIEDAIVSAVLELRTSPTTPPRQYGYIYFRPTTLEQTPIKLGELFSTTGSFAKQLGDVRVPDCHESVLHARLHGVPGLSDSTFDLTTGKSYNKDFGPEKSMHLVITFKLNDRKPVITVQLFPSLKYGEDSRDSFRTWLNSRKKERERLLNELRKELKTHVVNKPATWRTLVTMPTKVPRDGAGVRIGPPQLPTPGQQQTIVRTFIEKVTDPQLLTIVQRMLTPEAGASDTENLARAFKELGDDKKKYPHLPDWDRDLQSLSKDLRLHVRLTRVPELPKGDDKRPTPEIDYYIAGKP